MIGRGARAARSWVLAGALAAGSAAFASGAQAQGEEMPPFGGPDSIAFAADLWAALMDGGLVGPDAIRAFPYMGGVPHGEVLVTLESMVTVAERHATVLVKKNYTMEGVTVQGVADDPGQLHDVTVMFRREAGYDDDNRNWFWAKYSMDGDVLVGPPGALAGRVLKGMDAGCIACHTNAPGDDMVFINDRHGMGDLAMPAEEGGARKYDEPGGLAAAM